MYILYISRCKMIHMHFLDTTVLILIYRINIIQCIKCPCVVLLLSSADVFDLS